MVYIFSVKLTFSAEDGILRIMKKLSIEIIGCICYERIDIDGSDFVEFEKAEKYKTYTDFFS